MKQQKQKLQHNYEEFKQVVQKIKNRKAPGYNLINEKLIKYAGDSIQNKLQELIKEVWNMKKMPEE